MKNVKLLFGILALISSSLKAQIDYFPEKPQNPNNSQKIIVERFCDMCDNRYKYQKIIYQYNEKGNKLLNSFRVINDKRDGKEEYEFTNDKLIGYKGYYSFRQIYGEDEEKVIWDSTEISLEMIYVYENKGNQLTRVIQFDREKRSINKDVIIKYTKNGKIKSEEAIVYPPYTVTTDNEEKLLFDPLKEILVTFEKEELVFRKKEFTYNKNQNIEAIYLYENKILKSIEARKYDNKNRLVERIFKDDSNKINKIVATKYLKKQKVVTYKIFNMENNEVDEKQIIFTYDKNGNLIKAEFYIENNLAQRDNYTYSNQKL